MPVNQPPISGEFAEDSWRYETTRFINELEQILQRGRATRGPAFIPEPEEGAEHYLSEDVDTTIVKGWYKYDIVDGWIKI